MFIAENISQSISEKEFDSKPDTSKQVEYLVNLMSILAHYVKKYNNTSDPPGPFSVPNMKVFLCLLCPFCHTFFRTSLCVLRTHRESRFCNPHVVILLNSTSSS
jgi:hypothetical protein